MQTVQLRIAGCTSACAEAMQAASFLIVQYGLAVDWRFFGWFVSEIFLPTCVRNFFTRFVRLPIFVRMEKQKDELCSRLFFR